jgi:hypothetical protein
MSLPGGASLQAPIASMTSKLKEALSVDGEHEVHGSERATESKTERVGSTRAPKNRPLPSNVTEEQLDTAIDEIREIVGASHVDWVDLDNLVEGSYLEPPKTHDCYYMLDQNDLVVSAIVRPGNTEHVQAIMRIANRHKIPIWVTSIGRNVGYGGAARTLISRN